MGEREFLSLLCSRLIVLCFFSVPHGNRQREHNISLMYCLIAVLARLQEHPLSAASLIGIQLEVNSPFPNTRRTPLVLTHKHLLIFIKNTPLRDLEQSWLMTRLCWCQKIFQ